MFQFSERFSGKLGENIMKTYKINHKLVTILTIAGLISSIANMLVLEVCKAITEDPTTD